MLKSKVPIIFIILALVLFMSPCCNVTESDKISSIINFALFFDGADDIILINNPDSNLNNLYDRFTIQCWIKVESIPNSFAYIIDRTDNSASAPYGKRFQLSLRQESQSVHFNVNSIGLIGPTIEFNEWYNVAVVFDKPMMKIYLDGELSASLIVSMNLNVKQSIMTIGNELGFTRPFHGYLDEISFWNIALSNNQIHSNMSGNITYPQEGLFSYFPILSGSDTVFVDIVGQNHGLLGVTEGYNINAPQILDVGNIW